MWLDTPSAGDCVILLYFSSSAGTHASCILQVRVEKTMEESSCTQICGQFFFLVSSSLKLDPRRPELLLAPSMS